MQMDHTLQLFRQKNRYSVMLLSVILILFGAKEGKAVENWGCFGAGVAEYFVPGLGYAMTGQWDKAIIFGGGRWIAANHYFDAVESPYYQEDPDDIYQVTSADDSTSGKTETIVTMTRETWQANYYGSLYTNVMLISWGDLYQSGCQSNMDAYALTFAPFRFDHFYDKWQFWVPITIAIGNYIYFTDNSIVEYNLKRGLTKDDLNRDSFSQYYLVGVGEEMFFRGTVQHYLFNLFSKSWGISPFASRHLSVFSASAVFAAAHTGSGFTANPATAFLFGVYEGYVYHPSLDEFDLMTAIAIHSWWDLLVSYAVLNHASYNETQAEIEWPLFRIGFRF